MNLLKSTPADPTGAAPGTVIEEKIAFEAREDRVPLSGTFFYTRQSHDRRREEGSPASCCAVLISAATGVRASFYSDYAMFLALQGCLVMTYDYRGIGQSLQKGTRLVSYAAARIYPEWTMHDQIAAIAELARRASERGTYEIVIVGHSVGAHVALVAAPKLLRSYGVARCFFVAANSAYTANLRLAPHRALLFSYAMNWASRVIRRFPSGSVGLGDDIPMAAGQQWSLWSRRRRYFLEAQPGELLTDLKNMPIAAAARDFSVPVLSLSFTDDEITTAQSFADFLAMAPNATRCWYHLDPANLGYKAMGHHGFFKKRQGGSENAADTVAAKSSLWHASIEWVMHSKCSHFMGHPPSIIAKIGDGGFDWADESGRQFLNTTPPPLPKSKI